jgi:hypothetical protein
VIAVNFGDETELPLAGADRYETLVHTGEPRFGGNAAAPRAGTAALLLPGHHASFLRPL